jgi:hypothetical protein
MNFRIFKKFIFLLKKSKILKNLKIFKTPEIIEKSKIINEKVKNI